MPFRKVSAKENHYIQLKNKYIKTYNDFLYFIDEQSEGRTSETSGKARSYASYLFFMAVLYEEHFKTTISDLSSKAGYEAIETIKNLEGFTKYNIDENRFPNATFNSYKSYIKMKLFTAGSEQGDREEVRDTVVTKHIHDYLQSKGFNYSLINIANFYLSLRSKPFVILSGISGTGKTKIVELFAEAVGATSDKGNERFKLIPVRPDWSDNSDLIGYTDLSGKFIKGPLTEMIIRAHENPSLPHFVVLDEMNLARVEYYLSDFLSVVESRKEVDGNISTVPIVEVKEDTHEKKVYGLPENLYIIGTVNMDETTHPFSKKVLDRANSIEFNEINLMDFASLTKANINEVASKELKNDYFRSNYLYLKDVYKAHPQLVERTSEQLVAINQELQRVYAQVGYRVRDEICFYLAYNEELQLLSQEEAMDYCIMQKILPRLSGAGGEIEQVLKALFKQFAGTDFEDEKTVVNEDAKYVRSANKVREMLQRLHRQGFVSYWIS